MTTPARLPEADPEDDESPRCRSAAGALCRAARSVADAPRGVVLLGLRVEQQEHDDAGDDESEQSEEQEPPPADCSPDEREELDADRGVAAEQEQPGRLVLDRLDAADQRHD